MTVQIINGDCLEQLRKLPAESVHMVMTSPPYWGLRDYGTGEGVGLEGTPAEHIAALVAVFAEARRVLRSDGTLWIVYGDSFSHGGNGGRDRERWPKQARNDHRVQHSKFGASKPKDLLLLPARLSIALQDAGWWVRQQFPWVKRSGMPESMQDRATSSVEYVFMLSKGADYYYDRYAVCKPVASDTRARYRRGRSASHKNADGGPGGQSILSSFDHIPPSATRAWRNTDLFFESVEAPNGWIAAADGSPVGIDVAPKGFAGAHFATYPPKLIEPCIKAGTSERGVCSSCGAPWVREIGEPQKAAGRSSGNKKRKYGKDRGGNPDRPSGQGSSVPWSPSIVPTVGWSASCDCEAGDPVPAVILDPFAGAGTTGLVAAKLGRDAILIELNSAYCAMIDRRLKAALVQTEGEPAPADDHGPLFGSRV